MKLIQVILLAATALFSVFYFRKFQKSIINKVVLLLIASAAGLLIIFPDLSTKIAQKVGVGRGADLVFYLAIFFFLFCIAILYGKISLLEKKLTALVRKQALEDFEKKH